MSFNKFLAQTTKSHNKKVLDFVVTRRRDSYFDPQKNHEWCSEHKIDHFFVGRFLGEQKKYFTPSPYGIELASTQAQDNQKIVLEEKGAWLFLCGRDAFGKAVKKGKAKKGRTVFLYDNADNILGYGEWMVNDLTPREAEQVVIKNLGDKGSYIRRE